MMMMGHTEPMNVKCRRRTFASFEVCGWVVQPRALSAHTGDSVRTRAPGGVFLRRFFFDWLFKCKARKSNGFFRSGSGRAPCPPRRPFNRAVGKGPGSTAQ